MLSAVNNALFTGAPCTRSYLAVGDIGKTVPPSNLEVNTFDILS